MGFPIGDLKKNYRMTFDFCLWDGYNSLSEPGHCCIKQITAHKPKLYATPANYYYYYYYQGKGMLPVSPAHSN